MDVFCLSITTLPKFLIIFWFSVFGMRFFSFSSNLTSLSLLPSLSSPPQRIFNSFVYTEKTSNGETEVQQVSHKHFSLCVFVCVCLPGLCMCVSWMVSARCCWNEHTHHQRKGGFIKIQWLLSHWPWSSPSVFPLLCELFLSPQMLVSPSARSASAGLHAEEWECHLCEICRFIWCDRKSKVVCANLVLCTGKLCSKSLASGTRRCVCACVCCCTDA